MPFRVVSVTTPTPLIAPLVQFTTPFSNARQGTGSMFGQPQKSTISSGKSPFTIVPIPSINKTQPDELPKVSEHVLSVCTCVHECVSHTALVFTYECA